MFCTTWTICRNLLATINTLKLDMHSPGALTKEYNHYKLQTKSERQSKLHENISLPMSMLNLNYTYEFDFNFFNLKS